MSSDLFLVDLLPLFTADITLPFHNLSLEQNVLSLNGHKASLPYCLL